MSDKTMAIMLLVSILIIISVTFVAGDYVTGGGMLGGLFGAILMGWLLGR